MESLAKIGIKNLFEAILFIPKSYTNTYLLTQLNPNICGVVKISISDKKYYRNVLKISALMVDFDELLEITIFNAKPFHNKIFSLNSQIYIYGKLEYSGIWRMNQPKITNDINNIVMNFPKTKMQNKNLNEIFRRIINKDDLDSLGLRNSVVEAIWTIFHPESSQSYVDNFTKNNGLFGEYLRAIKFVEIFYYMKRLRGKKNTFYATQILNGNYKDFLDSLPFRLTNGQMECIKMLSSKLKSEIATRCVIMGDVGCGKTIIILSCVMMAYPKKSILLVPTTILARQLYNEAKKFLPPFIKVDLLIKDEGMPQNSDFLIGTHALLYRDLQDFALFMTDEQHRFGTKQRLKIEQSLSIKGKKPHSLQFSATPIPRTMALIEGNLVDFCFIKDLPFEKNILTKIITKADFGSLIEHIKNDISQNKQVAIIYPLVEKSDTIGYQSIEEGLPFWQKNFENVYFTYGKDKQKEEIIEEFMEKGDVLIATTLFEVGISLPRLSSIIIVGAERLGFATLHQLRGRVSRNGLEGFCFLYTNKPDSKRLRDFIKTTNGFEIAELDLKYRNSGDILSGIRQSGEQFIYFDMSSDGEIARDANQHLNHSKNY